MFYTRWMPDHTPPSSARAATLTIKIGRLLEAHATGWAVAAVPVVLVLVLGTALLILLLRQRGII